MPPSVQRPFAGLKRINLEGVQFRLVDAEHQVVGRLCAQLSKILQGKDKPIYAPERDHGDICVVINAAKAVLTGRKWDDKTYSWYTGAPGGLRSISAKELWRKDPTDIIRRAVNGMLPKNNLRDDRMRKLRIFLGSSHAFEGFDLVPFHMPARQLEDKQLGWAMPQGFEPMNHEAYARRMRGSRRPKGGPGSGAGGVVTFQDMMSPEELRLVECLAPRQQARSNSSTGRRRADSRGKGDMESR